MRDFKIKVSTPEADEPEECNGSFDDDEWRDLRDFVEAVNAVVATRFMRSPAEASLRIKAEAGEAPRIETVLPSEGDLAEFLHRLRPIILENDRTSFVRVASILGRRIDSKPVRALLKAQRRRFDGKDQDVEIRQGEVRINSEKVLKDWLNAFEYHPDHEKREVLKALHRIFPLDASKVLFLSQLVEKVKAAHVLGTLIENIHRGDGTKFEFPDFRVGE